MPPVRRATTGQSRLSSSVASSIPTDQPASGAGPAMARSPPRLTRNPPGSCRSAGARRPVGGPGLGGGAEVDLHAVRDQHPMRFLVEHDPPEARRRFVVDDATGHWAAEHRGQVVVVAQPEHGGADSGIDQAVGTPRHPDRRGQQVGEQRADADHPPARQRAELGVGAEAGASQVQLVELRLGDGGSGLGDPFVGGQHVANRADGHEAAQAAHHEPPEEVWAGPDDWLGLVDVPQSSLLPLWLALELAPAEPSADEVDDEALAGVAVMARAPAIPETAAAAETATAIVARRTVASPEVRAAIRAVRWSSLVMDPPCRRELCRCCAQRLVQP